MSFKPVPAKPVVSISGNVLTSSATAGNQWYNGTGPISGQTGQTFTATTTGSYYTIVTVNGCASPASDPVSFPATGIHKAEHFPVAVYPNPNKGVFTVKLNNANGEEVQLRLLDMTGRILLTQTATSAEFTVATSALADGTYLLEAVLNNEVTRVKLLVKR